MLQRHTSPTGVVVYLSPALQSVGVPHGFSTRLGGVSPAPFCSLNLGNPTGTEAQDDEGNIDANYRIFQESVSLGGRERASVHQVHGADVVQVVEHAPHDRRQKADAMVTRDSRRALAVRVADCVPVLLASEDGRTVAAVHAGWRGVVAGTVTVALARMSVAAGGVVAAVGPCIGPEVFEVGPEVVAAFRRAFGPAADDGRLVRPRPDGKGYIDLREAVRRQLAAAGVAHIDVSDRCSASDAGEFFSHRRDNGTTGRMAAMIGPRQ